MTNKKHLRKTLLAQVCALTIAGCGSQPAKQGGAGTLADLDLSSAEPVPTLAATQQTPSPAQPDQGAKDIKQAYYDYIKNAAKGDRLRVNAVTRIAELELEEITDNEAAYQRKVRNTINLLEDTLRDLPDVSDGDQAYYLLAKAYDQVGQGAQAIDTLKRLVKTYPKTVYLVESKFRIGEDAFLQGHFFEAEDAYTDVLRNSGADVFFEKALFKRGWARYKQNLYPEALEDFYAALERHEFDDYERLKAGEKALFDEYFRAIALSFSYLGGPEEIQDYIADQTDSAYQYRTYHTVAQLQLERDQYSDAAATYRAFIQAFPVHPKVVTAAMQTVAAWKNSGFVDQYVQAFEQFYLGYNPNAAYWRQPGAVFSEADKKSAIATIRDSLVLLAGRYHNEYIKQPNAKRLATAKLWYERYLDGYQAYARQDKVYQLYGELLRKSGEDQSALRYFELAAFDGDIVLDKDAAYSAIFLSNRLIDQSPEPQKQNYLDKHLGFVAAYAQLYPLESKTPELVQNAVERAFKAQQLDRVIVLANAMPDNAPAARLSQVMLLKAQAHFDQQQLQEAELVYRDLMASGQNTRDVQDKLALSLYKQAEQAQANGNTAEATRQFLRIAEEVPQSELAPTGMYDAIAVFMQQEQWDSAIGYLNEFTKRYPSHPNQKDVAQKLSVAYLKSGKGIEAAQAFENLTNFAANEEERRAAQWQAGKLYLEKKDYASALRAYGEYANAYPRPYGPYMESMHIVSDLHKKLGDDAKRQLWLRKITDADKTTSVDNKTERTQFIVASAAFDMAGLRLDEYKRVRLVHPLARSLKTKKALMQDVVVLFGQATAHGHEDFVTQSTYKIGALYRDFAAALLDSERPKNLNAEELEQYDILLEDQAFPFEDKAIEFYEANMARISGGLFDDWTKRSLSELRELYPARYNRSGLVETAFRQL